MALARHIHCDRGGDSDFGLLREDQRVIDFDAEVERCAQRHVGQSGRVIACDLRLVRRKSPPLV